MNNFTIRKICPLPSELSGIKKNIPCTEEGCNSTFLNTSNLDMHLSKHHKKTSVDLLKKGDSQTIFQYHCPVEKCLYNMKADRFFKNMKYLKQHYLKVHAEKMYQCEKCQKGFSTETAQKKHTRTCGMKFTCSCGFSYESYEALLTHAKRHQHTFDEKYRFYGKCIPVPVETDMSCKDMHRPFSVPINSLAAVALTELPAHTITNTVSRAVQTDRVVDTKRTRKSTAHPKATKRKTSAQTQTGSIPRNRHPTTSTETQTIGDYILKKAMKAADIPVIHKGVGISDKKMETTAKKRRKSMETQTTQLINNTLYCKENDDSNIMSKEYSNSHIFTATEDSLSGANNFASLAHSSNLQFSLFEGSDCFSLDVDSFSNFWQKSSSGTQTSPVNPSNLILKNDTLSHGMTQTEWNNILLRSKSYSQASGNMSSSSQTVNDLSSFFECSVESNSQNNNIGEDCGFDLPCGTQLSNVTDFREDSNYSSHQLDNILTHTVSLFDESWSCTTETQTELDFNSCFFNDDDTSFTHYFNTETQTSEEVDNLGHLLYSNNCTQTNDIVRLSEFADIQTQTGGPQRGCNSVLISTETQTAVLEGSDTHSGGLAKQWPVAGKTTAMLTRDNELQASSIDFKDFIIDLVKRDTNDKFL